MKKLLGVTTALVTLGAFAASAQAADPIKLELGGYSYWYLGYASNGKKAGDRQELDIKGDNEVWFAGSTKLDNGITVGVQIELEAGGHTDTTTGGDVIDESYVFVEGSFGKFIIGTEDNAIALLHVSAPDVGLGLSDGDYGFWVMSPANWTTFSEFATTWADRDGDAEKIIYFTPQFHGLTFGVSYTPNFTEDNRATAALPAGTSHDALALSLGYTREFGAVSFASSAGYYRSSVEGYDATQEFTVGAKIGYAGWALGGSFRHGEEDDRSPTAAGLDGIAWDVGVSYTSGPFAVSLGYFGSDVQGTGGPRTGDDHMNLYQLSGAYTMGPGITLIGSLFYNEYDGSAATAENDGVGFVTGMRLVF